VVLRRWRLRLGWLWDPLEWGWDQKVFPSGAAPLFTSWRRGPLLLFRFVPQEAVLTWRPPPRGPRGDPANVARHKAVADWYFTLAFYGLPPAEIIAHMERNLSP